MWVFENRVLRIIFGPKRSRVTGEWTKLHNEELKDLYSSPYILRVINSRRMRWAAYVARMEEGRCAQGFGGYLRESDHQGDQDLDGRVIKIRIFVKWEGVVRSGLSCVRISRVGGLL